MKLVIDISALDKTRAAVVSVSDATPVNAQQLVLGDTEPMDVTFTDSSASPMAAPSWAGAPGYVLILGLGTMDANTFLCYTQARSTASKTGGWTAHLELTTNALRDAVVMAIATGNGYRNIATDPRSRNQLPSWCYLWLQIQVLTPDLDPVTYGMIRVPMLNRVLPNPAISTPAGDSALLAWISQNAVRNAAVITGLASAVEDATKLGGCAAGASGFPVGATIILNFPVTINDGGNPPTHAGTMTLIYQVQASTVDNAPRWVRPYNYDLSTNAIAYRLVGAFLDTLPASWNATTGKFHYMGVEGAAGATTIYSDQTGTSAPT